MKRVPSVVFPSLVCSLVSGALLVVLAACDGSTGADGSPAAPPEGGSAEPLADVLERPDGLDKLRELADRLAARGPEAAPEVERLLDDEAQFLDPAEALLLVRFWAEHAPADALSWSVRFAPLLFHHAAVSTAVETWAADDPAAAVAGIPKALAELPGHDLDRDVEMALIEGWFESGDREGLDEFLVSQPTGRNRQRMILAFALALAGAEGSDAAIRWAESRPEEDEAFRLAAFRQVMSALATVDWPAAMRFCAAHCISKDGLINVVINRRLGRGDPGGEIVTWVAGLPAETEEQREMVEEKAWIAYAHWAVRERPAALEWMQQKLESGAVEEEPWLGALQGEYARQLSAVAPFPDAIAAAQRVENEREREMTLVRLARGWLLEDAEAAEAWLETSSLSERARNRARRTDWPTYLPVRESARKSAQQGS